MRQTQISRTSYQDADKALEHAASKLLAESARERGYGEYPFHNLRWENQAAAYDESIRRQRHETDVLGETTASVPDILRTLFTKLQLDAQERVILRYLAQGMSAVDIQARLNLPPNTVRNMMRRLRRKVRTLGLTREDFTVAPSEIQEVIAEACQIHAYHEEQHCTRGEERCAKTGKCACRWYLRQAI